MARKGEVMSPFALPGKKRIRVAITSMLMSILAALLLGVATPSPASAVTQVSGCAGWNQQTCVVAQMGTKDYANHRQWVGNVTTSVINTGGMPSSVESWGDGFWRIAYSTRSATWGINKWVTSGTNICGATNMGGTRQIACIAITV